MPRHPNVKCWRCDGTRFECHEEGPAGATWTVREPCRECNQTEARKNLMRKLIKNAG